MLAGILTLSASIAHPIKLTASLIEYNPKSKSIRVECRVFIDDFESSLNIDGLDVAALTPEHQLDIEYFFYEFYRFSLNGQPLDLKFADSEAFQANNLLVLEFLIKDVKLKKGDKLHIENSLFFMEFGEQQSNRMIIRIPPYVFEENHITTIDNRLVSYKL
ncbi:MAG TPA: hypothetical protein DCE41_24400 [Cytophagales bacterium]|nr:hypothetical protein [Cytophagales bacterium]